MRNRVDGRWDIAVVALLAGTFGIATNRSIGWFYVAYMDEFSVDRQRASWPGSVLLAVFRGAGLLVTVLHRRLSLRSIGLLGSCVLWGGIAASVFAPDIAWMTFTIGVLHGIGCGMLLISNMVLIMQYFKKYRGVATGLRLTANPLSALVFPPVLSALKNSYGFRGALLIYTAIIMHVTALALYLKEPPWLQPKKSNENTANSLESSKEIESIDEVECNSCLLSKADEPAGAAFCIHVVIEESRKRSSSIIEAEALLQNRRGTPCGTKSKSAETDVPSPKDEFYNEVSDSEALDIGENGKICIRNEHACGCSSSKENEALQQLLPVAEDEIKGLGIRSIRTGQCTVRKDALPLGSGKRREIVGKEGKITLGGPNSQSKVSITRRVQKQLRRSLPVRTPSLSFIVCVMGSMLVDYINSIHLFTFVDYARDKDVPHHHAAMTLTYAAGPEIVGRVFLPFVADIGWVSRSAMVCGNMCVAGLLLSITPQTSAAMHVVLRALTSVSIAALLTMKHVLIADYLGSEAVSIVSGASGLLLLPVIFCNPLIFGYFRDTIGSYDNLFRISGGVLCAASLMVGRLLFLRKTKSKVTGSTVIEQ